MPISKNWDQHVTCWPNSQKKHQRKFISIFIEQYLKVTCRSQKIEINMWLVGPTRKKKHQRKFISIFIKQYWKVTCRSQKIEINMWLVGPTSKNWSQHVIFLYHMSTSKNWSRHVIFLYHMPTSKNWSQHVIFLYHMPTSDFCWSLVDFVTDGHHDIRHQGLEMRQMHFELW